MTLAPLEAFVETNLSNEPKELSSPLPTRTAQRTANLTNSKISVGSQWEPDQGQEIGIGDRL
eukprot:scaffold7714_cov133-Isochrysis_galbana.AAC.4